MQPSTLIEREEKKGSAPSVSELCDLAAAGLVEMLDPERQLFCDIYNRTESGMIRERLSPRYTMMTLLGLHRHERSGRRSPVAIAPVLDTLLADTKWIASAGDLGLLLWTCAELVPDRLPDVYREVGAQGALARFSDGRQGSTMEVAWYLTGIASCYLAGHGNLAGLAEQAGAARQILEENCGASGVYGHLSRNRSWSGYVRGRIGSFADQVYPTIASARLSQALQDEKARQMALRTAEKMCELQAPLGEWSWQYDSVSGKVVSRYPCVFRASARYGADDVVRGQRGDGPRLQRCNLQGPGMDQRPERTGARLRRAVAWSGVALYLSRFDGRLYR